jgi:hypothetical protein
MKPFRETTSSSVVVQNFLDVGCSDSDVLFRVMLGNERNPVIITSTNTQTVRDGLNTYRVRHLQDVDLLCSVIVWQKRTIDYQALHTAFLLNSLSEEEFEQESEKFTVYQKNVVPEKIAAVIERIDSLVGINFDTSDYSDYFQCSQENVMEGLRLLPHHQHFLAMLPVSAEK